MGAKPDMRPNADATLYTLTVVGSTEVWTRTEVPGVHWENCKAANTLASGGSIAADQAAIYIPLHNRPELPAIKPNDIIVRGIVDDEIGAGFTVSDLKRKYPDVLRITSVDLMNYGRRQLWHYQLGAK